MVVAVVVEGKMMMWRRWGRCGGRGGGEEDEEDGQGEQEEQEEQEEETGAIKDGVAAIFGCCHILALLLSNT